MVAPNARHLHNVTTTSFSEWVASEGENCLAEAIADSQRANKQIWADRNSPIKLRACPAWELCLGFYWKESENEWHSRWQNCGGRLFGGRMIAVKWDAIWERLGRTFYDGLGCPYPPYARSSCAYWKDIGQDEAIVAGVISESEFNAYVAQFPLEAIESTNINTMPAEFLQALEKDLEEEARCNGATRAERVAYGLKAQQDSFARSQAEYERRNAGTDDQNAVFRLLEQVEESLRDAPVVQDPRRWEWLCSSLTTLTATVYFDRYPNWRARAWVASAELYRMKSDSANELACLVCALKLNDRLPIKRRIKKLQG